MNTMNAWEEDSFHYIDSIFKRVLMNLSFQRQNELVMMLNLSTVYTQNKPLKFINNTHNFR